MPTPMTLDRIHRDIERQTKQLNAITQELKRLMN